MTSGDFDTGIISDKVKKIARENGFIHNTNNDFLVKSIK